MKDLIISKLETRTTDELKQDVKVAMDSEDENSTLIFVCALDVLEKRLSKSEYHQFEESL